MADKKVLKSFMWGALTGAVTGAVSALLLAPKSGKELRKDISETAHKIGDKTAEAGRQASAAVQSLARTAGRLVTDIRSRKDSEPAARENAKDSSTVQSDEAEETLIAR